MDNKKEQTELKATNIISLFHPKKKKNFLKKAGRHFGFLKKAGRHQKGAGRRALQKRPRQNTVILVKNCFVNARLNRRLLLYLSADSHHFLVKMEDILLVQRDVSSCGICCAGEPDDPWCDGRGHDCQRYGSIHPLQEGKLLSHMYECST